MAADANPGRWTRPKRFPRSKRQQRSRYGLALRRIRHLISATIELAASSIKRIRFFLPIRLSICLPDGYELELALSLGRSLKQPADDYGNKQACLSAVAAVALPVVIRKAETDTQTDMETQWKNRIDSWQL